MTDGDPTAKAGGVFDRWRCDAIMSSSPRRLCTIITPPRRDDPRRRRQKSTPAAAMQTPKADPEQQLYRASRSSGCLDAGRSEGGRSRRSAATRLDHGRLDNARLATRRIVIVCGSLGRLRKWLFVDDSPRQHRVEPLRRIAARSSAPREALPLTFRQLARFFRTQGAPAGVRCPQGIAGLP